MSAYFAKDEILSVDGEHLSFRRISDAGRKMEFHFCPKCGSTVFWYAEAFPEHVGVAVGCYADAEFLPPTFAGWTADKHTWVSFPAVFPQALEGEEGTGSERLDRVE